MIISTTRFGEIEVDESRIVEMRGGILGFDHLKRYILIVHGEETPFCWFQSIEEGAVAFVVINPFLVKPDYEPVIGKEDLGLLSIEKVEDVVLLSIVTIRSNPFAVSANLRAPLVINVKKMAAKQVVLNDPTQPLQYYIETGHAVGERGEKGQEKTFNMTQIGHAVAF